MWGGGSCSPRRPPPFPPSAARDEKRRRGAPIQGKAVVFFSSGGETWLGISRSSPSNIGCLSRPNKSLSAVATAGFNPRQLSFPPLPCWPEREQQEKRSRRKAEPILGRVGCGCPSLANFEDWVGFNFQPSWLGPFWELKPTNLLKLDSPENRSSEDFQTDLLPPKPGGKKKKTNPNRPGSKGDTRLFP